MIFRPRLRRREGAPARRQYVPRRPRDREMKIVGREIER